MTYTVTVLSPHRDDAIFSLCLCLINWTNLGVPITVLNFFTESTYAPRMHSNARSSVSTVRSREDRAALFAIHPSIRAKSLGLLDAPLRLRIPTESISDVIFQGEDKVSDVQLQPTLLRYINRSLIIAPLGLGNHIDHCAVRDAAIVTCPPERLAFYEDLPYASWTNETVLQEKAITAMRKTGCSLRPAIIRHKHAVLRKRRAVLRYDSQIDATAAAQIARFALKYRGAERIWIPKNGRWPAFVLASRRS